MVGVLAGAAIAANARYGPGLSHWLRETLLWLTPERALAGAVILAGLLGATSVAFRGASPKRRGRPAVRPPVIVFLGLIVIAASMLRLLLGRAKTEPSVLGDELVYSGLAKGFALEGLPLLRGELDLAHSLLYPLVLSPAHLLAADGARAFEATKSINAIVVASAAIPAYLLARRLMPPAWALVVAALVAFEPWTAYASLVMTESLFLPAFTTFALLLARMIERPALGRQVAVLVALALLVTIRPQGLVLAGAILLAIVIDVRGPRSTRSVSTYAPLLVGLGAAGLATVVALAAGAGIAAGAVTDVVRSFGDPLGLAAWTLRSLAVYELALGVVALALFPFALRGLLRSSSDQVRATGIALLACSVALVLSVAAVSASPSGLDILHERYLFYLTPLVLAGLAHWLHTGSTLSRAAVWSSALVSVAVAASLPADQIVRANNVDSPTAVWVLALHASIPDVPIRLLVVGLAAFGALVLVGSRGRGIPILTVVVAFTALVCGLDYSGPFGQAQARAHGWVDQSLPRDGRASLVHLAYSRPDQPCGEAADWEQQGFVVSTEFFNTRINRVYHLNEQIGRDHLGSPSLSVEAGGVVHHDGQPFNPPYAVLDSRQPIVGTKLARLDLASLGSQYQSGASLTLWKVEPPLRFLVHAQPLPPRADGKEC